MTPEDEPPLAPLPFTPASDSGASSAVCPPPAAASITNGLPNVEEEHMNQANGTTEARAAPTSEGVTNVNTWTTPATKADVIAVQNELTELKAALIAGPITPSNSEDPALGAAQPSTPRVAPAVAAAQTFKPAGINTAGKLKLRCTR